MENIYLLIFLLSPFLLLVGLIKPALFSKVLKRNVTRKGIIIGCLLSAIGSFIGFGITADPPTEKEEVVLSSNVNETPKPETEVSSLSIDANNVVSGKILRVVDGDTVEVSIDSKTEKVRIIGIDTPETVDPRKSVECFGIEASNKAKEVLTIDSEVYLESDPSQDNRDNFNRLLRYIWINENTDFGKHMIEEGYAYEYTYKTPYKHKSLYEQAQKDAESNYKGFWAGGVCDISPTLTIKAPNPTAVPIIYKSPTSALYIAPINPPATTSNDTSGSWTCNCSKTCPNMSSCAEAQYQLNICGCSARDADKDGIACDADCQ